MEKHAICDLIPLLSGKLQLHTVAMEFGMFKCFPQI